LVTLVEFIGEGAKNAWNHPDRVFDSGTCRRISALDAQPRLGLLPDRWRRAGSRGGPRARIARADLDSVLVSDWRLAMDESKRSAVSFLEKEIKTYKALSLFLLKKDLNDHVRVGGKKVMISPAFYKDRMKEAKKIVSELKKTN
jgi:hypothetical protein